MDEESASSPLSSGRLSSIAGSLTTYVWTGTRVLRSISCVSSCADKAYAAGEVCISWHSCEEGSECGVAYGIITDILKYQLYTTSPVKLFFRVELWPVARNNVGFLYIKKPALRTALVVAAPQLVGTFFLMLPTAASGVFRVVILDDP
jgi:hypothetical protein